MYRHGVQTYRGVESWQVYWALSEDAVKGIWEMRFTAEMRKHSKAIAERAGLLDSTEA